MSKRCAVCGSYASNIAVKSGLCDVHFYKTQRDELLEALKELLAREWQDDEEKCTLQKARLKARAAIAKAEGSTI